MNGSSRSYPRQMGYYYPQHMQGYYQQAAPGYLEQQLPQQHYGQQDYYQPYAPIQPMLCSRLYFLTLILSQGLINSSLHNFKALCRSSKSQWAI